MKLVKIPKCEWAMWRTKLVRHYYVARVFDPCTEEHRAMVDEWGYILGAVSYSIDKDYVYVYSLGAVVRKQGIGSRLMAHVERRAIKRLGLPVRLASERSAVGFYEGRGYKKLPAQRVTSRIFAMKLDFGV